MANLFKWRKFDKDIIILCVRWYLRYVLSYRDITEMISERGISVDQSTIYRWVQKYAPIKDAPLCTTIFQFRKKSTACEPITMGSYFCANTPYQIYGTARMVCEKNYRAWMVSICTWNADWLKQNLMNPYKIQTMMHNELIKISNSFIWYARIHR